MTVVTGGFVVLPLLVAAGFVLSCEWASRRLRHPATVRRRRAACVGVAVVAWLGLTAVLAATGVLRRFDATPPPFALLALAVIVIGVALACSRLGTLLVRGLPLWFLVGFQVFRFPLELVMHRAAAQGVMPEQMSYSGYNYDIVTGITAGALGLWLWRRAAPRWAVASWNALGFVLLVNIVTIAVVSTPLFAWFGRDRLNTFVTYVPFVWLPGVLVTAALVGHLLVWRRLSAPLAADAATSRAC
jgi:hypothetical protein